MNRSNFALTFQTKTSFKSGRSVKVREKWEGKPVELPPPNIDRGKNVFKVIEERRSRRNLGGGVNINELSTVLWSSNGVTLKKRFVSLRAAPSAGALYSVENYVSIQRVDGIEQGIYYYEPEKHTLNPLFKGDHSRLLQRASLDQTFVGRAAFNIIWTANFRRFYPHYGERGLRYAYLDAGHIAENAILACVALGISSCPVGAYFDDEMNSILALKDEEVVIYLLSAGRPGEE